MRSLRGHRAQRGIAAAVIALAALVGLTCGTLAQAAPVTPLVRLAPTSLAPETPEQAAARHALVAQRRSRTSVLLHRGASYVARENTIAGLTAALDLGADGWEIDIRKTRDNVLVVFHDDYISRLLDGAGNLQEMTYEELLLYPCRGEPLRGPRRLWVPTFAEVLQLARNRGALMDLDIKGEGGPGVISMVADVIGRADMWDHVLGCPAFRSGITRLDPTYKPDRNSAWFIFDSHDITNGEDADLATIRAEIAEGATWLVPDDPRIVLEALGRPVGKYTPPPPQAAPEAVEPPDLQALLTGLFGISQNADSRHAAAQLINYYGPVAPAEVAKHFGPRLPHDVRLNIAWLMGMAARYYHDSVNGRAHFVLLDLRLDPDPDVRAEAARSLGYRGGAEDLPLLVSLAVEGKEAAGILTAELGLQARRSGLDGVREVAVEALARIGDATPEVMLALTAVGQRPEGGIGSAGEEAAIRALARLGVRESLPWLREMTMVDSRALIAANPWLTKQAATAILRQDSDTRAAARSAVATLGGPKDLELVASWFAALPPAGEDDETERAAKPRRELLSVVTILAGRDDAPARRACAEALLSPMGKIRREAFFRLWAAAHPEVSADAIAGAVLQRLEAGRDTTGCAMALHLLGELGRRSALVDQALAKGAAATQPDLREQAAWAREKLRR